MTRHLHHALLVAIAALLVGDVARAEGPPPPPPPGQLPAGARSRLAKKRPMSMEHAPPVADQPHLPSPAAPSPPAPTPMPPAGPGAPIAPGGAPATTGIGADSLMPGEKVATECAKFNLGKKYKWDQKGEIDLASLLAWAQATFCETIIVPANLRQQKITIYAPALMTPTEMYRMFLASLNAMGLTVQPQGGTKAKPIALVIVESTKAREMAIPLVGPNEDVPHTDQFVTKVLRLEHAQTEDVLPVLNRLKSGAGDVIPAPPSTLIITDGADNISRMEHVIRELDLPLNSDHIWMIPLHNVGATEMVTILTQIFQPKGGAGGAKGRINLAPASGATAAPPSESTGMGSELSVSQIIAEERTNTLIVVCTQNAYQRILGLIHRLDQTNSVIDSASDRLHVYFLANANAEDLASTLTGLGISVSRGRSGSTSRPGGAVPAPGGGAAGGNVSGLFEGDVKIASDKATNSLVIVASGRDYLTVRDLIRKLDLARRQVFLEATILEVSLDKSRKLGMSFHGGDTIFGGQNQSLLFGGVEPNNNTNSILFSPAALSGLAAGLRGPPIPGADKILGLPPGQSIPAFGVFIQALQNNNDVNVISMPHVLTSDNEKATISVGQNLPFPGSLGNSALGALAGAAGGATAGLGFGTSVQRQDVALKLEVTPHVNDSDFVRLEVDNEISDVSSPNYNNLGPATDKRTVKTVVVVRDQQAVVLGGLVKDRVSESVDKVPLLGDIPILGYFFKYTQKSITKQNLLIILTPYIIKDPEDLRRIFERKVAERREFLERNSAFQDKNSYEPTVDYRRKRGLLEEINRTALEAEQEAADLARAEASMRAKVIEGPVEPAQWSPPVTAPRSVPPPSPKDGSEVIPDTH